MDTSTLEQTASSLKYNNIDIFGVLIPNTEKTSRIQELKSIVSVPDDVIDAGFNSIADLLAFRMKRLVGCLGKNFTRNFTFLYPPYSETIIAFMSKLFSIWAVRLGGKGDKIGIILGTFGGLCRPVSQIPTQFQGKIFADSLAVS